jgi:hypothetical protein
LISNSSLYRYTAEAKAAEAAEEAAVEMEAADLERDLEAIAAAVASVAVAAPPGLGDAARRQLEAAQLELAEGLKAKVGAVLQVKSIDRNSHFEYKM